MTSDFMKKLREERKTNSKFLPGVVVAVVCHHRDRAVVRKGRVAKTYKNGNFVLHTRDGGVATAQWKPDRDGASARQAGGGHLAWSGEHLEVWTADHDLEVRAQKTRRSLESRRDALIEQIRTLRGDALTVNVVSRLEQVLSPIANEEEE